MIRTVLFDPRTGTREHGGEELLARWQRGSGRLLWADFGAEERGRERGLLKRHFDFDDLALDDCQRDRHPPKLEWFDDYFFLLLKGFTADTEDIDFGVVHISFFVGEDFLVTRHADRSPSIDQVLAQLEKGQEHMDRGAAHLCYRVVRTIIDRYAPIILGMEATLERLEDTMLESPTDVLLGELISYNSKLKKLRRIYGYQENVLAQLMNSGSPILGHEVRHEFIDAHEQMERLASLSALLQELTVDLMEGYISVSSHRLNRIMKVLTITTVVFLPLSLLAGIYGMNFDHIPELHVEHGYYVVLGAMGGIGVSLLVLFRILKWL